MRSLDPKFKKYLVKNVIPKSPSSKRIDLRLFSTENLIKAYLRHLIELSNSGKLKDEEVKNRHTNFMIYLHNQKELLLKIIENLSPAEQKKLGEIRKGFYGSPHADKAYGKLIKKKDSDYNPETDMILRDAASRIKSDKSPKLTKVEITALFNVIKEKKLIYLLNLIGQENLFKLGPHYESLIEKEQAEINQSLFDYRKSLHGEDKRATFSGLLKKIKLSDGRNLDIERESVRGKQPEKNK